MNEGVRFPHHWPQASLTKTTERMPPPAVAGLNQKPNPLNLFLGRPNMIVNKDFILAAYYEACRWGSPVSDAVGQVAALCGQNRRDGR